MAANRCLKFLVLLTACINIFACDSGGLKRPVGYFRVGLISDLRKPETYVPEEKLLVRHDEKGFSVMSTADTYDLTPLAHRKTAQGDVWQSNVTTSTYDHNGKVLKGPAKVDLPYYELQYASTTYAGPVDSLYAQVGVEKPPDWRLADVVPGAVGSSEPPTAAPPADK